MLSRKGNSNGKKLEINWINEIQKLISSVYLKECTKLNKDFHVYGEIFKNEITIAISLISLQDPNISPLTFMVSTDIKENKRINFKKIINLTVDTIGSFFDQYFNDTQWDEYHDWKIASVNNFDFFYKITRENILLTIEANKLLNKK